MDFIDHGFTEPEAIWVYKVDTDPEVQAALGGDWRNIDYLVLSRVTLVSEIDTMPLVAQAVEGGDVVMAFGSGDEEIVVMKVRK